MLFNDYRSIDRCRDDWHAYEINRTLIKDRIAHVLTITTPAQFIIWQVEKIKNTAGYLFIKHPMTILNHGSARYCIRPALRE